MLREAQLLRRDDETRFTYEFVHNELPCSFNVSAKYVNSVGYHGIQSFKVKCTRAENGNVDIHISKYIAS